MKNLATRLATAGGLIAIVAATTLGADQSANQSTERRFIGSTLFKSYCATCHGVGATGDGPLAAMLRKQPANLTLLGRRNGGVFSKEMVSRIIDGRKPMSGHGGGDMPVWGDAFARTSEGVESAPGKIAALVDYLESIQKP
jgi:mono/diheme cytochrome c family protein